ncbi:MAG: hypothetical protein M3Q44_01610 [bacterium]|nr:hypothetical protein [bacterium]
MNIAGLRLTKRKRFIIASAAITLATFIFPSMLKLYGPIVIAVYAATAYLVSIFALKEDISGIEYVTLFILPVLFTVGAGLFISIVPERKIYRWPLYAAVPISIYSIYLTENIFNVAGIRTIQLLRMANVFCYIITLVTSVFLFWFTLSLRLQIIENVLLICTIVTLLTLQFLWSFELTQKFTLKTLLYTAVSILVFAQISIVINFYAISTIYATLFLVSIYYVLLGLVHHYNEKKLTRKVAIEYTLAAFIVFVFMILSVQWQG